MLEGEQNLIRGAQSGEGSCFEALYDHYVPPIYRFIYMKVSGKEEAEDLTHEVFLSAWQNLKRYRPRGFPFSSWLYQIARNKVIDHYRLKKPALPIEEVDVEFAAAGKNLDDVIDTEIHFKKVRRALRSLTPDQQDVILMKFMEELSHREIAAALMKSEGAVRIIQYRALSELKKILADEPI